ncbi:MAG: alpha/beta hydrolase, partial [Ktedonobacterales bacterium]
MSRQVAERGTVAEDPAVQEYSHISAEQYLTFPSGGRPALLLEGRLTRPRDLTVGDRRAGVALCHPQPATSSMEDGLVRQLAQDLGQAGMVVLRFNFRGVGESQGQQTDGRLEPLDIAGAVEFLLEQPEVNPQKVCLIGHAFGAYMALAYAEHDSRIRTVVAVSPPVFRITPELGAFDRPKLIVTGEYDEVSPRHKLEPWLERIPARGLHVISGARHLMRGYEGVASANVVKYVARWATTPG